MTSRVRTSRVMTSRVRTSRVITSRVRTSRVMTSRVRTSRVMTHRVRTSRIMISRVRTSRVMTSRVRTSRVMTSRVRTSSVMKYRVRTSTVMTSRVRTSRVMTSTVRTSRVMTSTVRTSRVMTYKGSFFLYSAVSSPLDRSKRFTLFAFPGRPVHSDTNSASPGSILVRQQLRAKTKSLTCPPLSIARYSFIQLSQLGPQWRERKCPIFETVAKGDSNPGSLDCESGILPLSYRAP